MITKIGLIWMLASVVTHGKPGDLDNNFTPSLKAWVAPDHVTVAKDGRVWIGGGFARADKSSTGDLVRLGVNGGVAGEPAPGYLGKENLVSFGNAPPTQIAPFLLADGGFLLPGESGGWLRMSVAGKAMGKAFPDRRTGETLAPQFEQAGKLWVIRYRKDGRRILELRNSGNGTLDSSFTQGADWPGDPSDVVPGPVGNLWVLTADRSQLWDGINPTPSPAKVFQIDESGALIGTARQLLMGRQDTRLIAGPGGAFRVKYGQDWSFWYNWTTPMVSNHRIDWHDSNGELVRYQNFQMPAFGSPFCWAEAADGSFLATTLAPVAVGNQFGGLPTTLGRYHPDGSPDPAFQSHPNVRSVASLTGGKWLLDGLRRINADGSEDATWKETQLDRPAGIGLIIPLSDGRTLVGGDFAKANGLVRNRLVVFRPNGTVDPKFILDDRIREWTSVAVSGRAIYVVTPRPLSYGNGVISNLVKLEMDGKLIENYRPEISGSTFNIYSVLQPVTDVTTVHSIGRGEILAQTYGGYEVATAKFHRLRADGSQVAGFKNNRYPPMPGNVLTRKNGTFLIDGVLYSANGTVREDLTTPDVLLAPLCETRGGILFLETKNGTQRRLRIWKNSAWEPSFRAPVLDGFDEVTAVAGEQGNIYVSGTFKKNGSRLLRLFPNGSIDKSFTSPLFAIRERQLAGEWWKAEESGKVSWDVKSHQTRTRPQALFWHPLTKRLWVGGDFNVVNGRARDGLARIQGGLPHGWSWR